MTKKYDTVADAVYVSMTTEKVEKTIKASENILMDLDSNGNTVGIEILEASSQKELVKNLQDGVSNGVPVFINTSTAVVG